MGERDPLSGKAISIRDEKQIFRRTRCEARPEGETDPERDRRQRGKWGQEEEESWKGGENLVGGSPDRRGQGNPR